MHTVDLLDAAIRYAAELGIQVREEWLDGANGGECEIAGQRWLFLDLSQSPQERLHVIADCLAVHLPVSAAVPEHADPPPELLGIFRMRPAA